MVPFTYEYPRPALTVDVMVVTTEAIPHILLIRRRDEPFADRWALPGGFVDENEPLEQASRRELQEEAGIMVNELRQWRTVGDPGRDPRGWTVSVIYLALVPTQMLPIKAGDDASDVSWFPLTRLPNLAFDHRSLIEQAATTGAWHQ